MGDTVTSREAMLDGGRFRFGLDFGTMPCREGTYALLVETAQIVVSCCASGMCIPVCNRFADLEVHLYPKGALP